MSEQNLEWKCHTARLLEELKLVNPDGLGVLSKPVVIFARLLAQVAERASQLNDPVLNHLMCKLTLYEIADPLSPDYDKAMVKEIERLAREEKATWNEPT